MCGLFVFFPTFGYNQIAESTLPVKTTLCDLSQHPEQYAGKIIAVHGSVAGNDLWIDDFQQKPCSSWIPLVVVLPNVIRPTPEFNLVQDESFTRFFLGVHRGSGVEATFEGRFDAAFVWRNHKKIFVSKTKGYGKKNRYGGRIVLHRLSDVVIHGRMQL